VALDPNQLPDDPQTLRKMVLDLAAQLDWHSLEKNKLEGLLRELLDARHARKSERLSEEQTGLVRGGLAGAATRSGNPAGRLRR
jgi:hypothetical protein